MGFRFRPRIGPFVYSPSRHYKPASPESNLAALVVLGLLLLCLASCAVLGLLAR